jgi:hypothetical protein
MIAPATFPMTEISDEGLLKLIVAADDEAFLQGESPKQRSLSVISTVMKRLSYVEFIFAGAGTPPIFEKISNIHRSLYRRSDLAIGGIHGGIFMFRDVFARVSIPLAYGRIGIDPLTLTDFSPMQIKWLCSRPPDFHMFLDQFADIFDFAGGVGNLGNYKTPPKDALEVFWLAAFQLQAAAAALSVAFDHRGAVQSALIGAELALKGGLAAIGANENARKKHRHNLASAATAFAAAQPNFDIQRVLATIKRLPPYVANRYSSTQPGRVETGHIVMGAQYLAGEVMRQVTGYSIRSAQSPPPPERVYPSG